MAERAGRTDKEEALRDWAARQLNVSAIAEDEWVELIEEGYVDAALDGIHPTETARRDLLDELKDIRARKRAQARLHRRRPPTLIPPLQAIHLTEDEEERARLVSNALAREANAWPAVRQFRERWVPDDSARQQLSEKMIASDHDDAVFAELEPFDKEFRELQALLATRYPWSDIQAGEFLMSEEPPLVAPILAAVEATNHGSVTSGRIVLHIEPWVSDETVRRTYRFLQDCMLGKHNRPLHKRILRVIGFVAARLNKQGKPRPSWKDVYAEWRAHQAEFEQRDGMNAGSYRFRDPYSMKRAYDDGMTRMVAPEYNVPWPHSDPQQRGERRQAIFANHLPPLEYQPRSQQET